MIHFFTLGGKCFLTPKNQKYTYGRTLKLQISGAAVQWRMVWLAILIPTSPDAGV